MAEKLPGGGVGLAPWQVSSGWVHETEDLNPMLW